MDGLLLPIERAQPLEDGVDVTCVGGEVEDSFQIDAARERSIGAHQLTEILLLVPGAPRVPLNEPVGLVAREPGFDEREQEPLAVEEAMARLQVAPHALLPNDQPFDQPCEA